MNRHRERYKGPNRQKIQRKSEPHHLDFKKLTNVFKHKHTRLIFGILVLCFSLYTTISIIGFLFSGDTDQSMVDRGLQTIIANPNYTASNPTGPLGAWIADRLVNRWLGVAAFGVCFILFMWGAWIIKRPFENTLGKVITTLAVSLWISLFLGFTIESFNSIFGITANNLFLCGGHGFYVTHWLNSIIGYVGTFILLIATFLLIMILCFGELFHRIVTFIKNKYQEHKAQMAREEALRKHKQEAARRQQQIVNEQNKQAVAADQELSGSRQEQDIPPVVAPAFAKDARNTMEPNADFDNETTLPIIDKDGGNDFEVYTSEEKKDEIEEDSIENNTIELTLDLDENFNSEQDHEEEDILKSSTTQSDEKLEDELELTVNQITQEEKLLQNLAPYDPTLDLENYNYPPLDLLEEHSSGVPTVTKEELKANQDRIVETLRNYKIEIIKIKATIGPTVTLYEIIPAPGVKISKIKNLEDDIALSLSALGIRIIAPIPGAGTIGIEVPNQKPEVVSMHSIIASKRFQESKYALPIAMGRTISNETYTFDLAKMPHLLVAGATGQGKSVGLNAIITSLLYKKHPSQLKFVMVDPKKVELSIYSIIEKHFLAKLPDEEEAIITETSKVVNTLNSLCVEMDNRYDLLKKAHTRNIKEYNDKFIKRLLNPNDGHKYLPYIVVIVDEFADLIMTAGKEVEQPIARIAQLARAIGIHLIIATQRPSTNIITGVIKANFPARIAFKVASMIDSRTILDSPGANQLIGRGDMLISVGSEMTRVQCAFVDTPEVDSIAHFISKQQSYPTAFALPEYVAEGEDSFGAEADLGARDALFEEAARMVVISQQGSTSSIQRRFSIGYNRAGRIMDQLEAAGIVGKYEGSKARSVLVQDQYELDMKLQKL